MKALAVLCALLWSLCAYASQCTQYTAAGSPWMTTKLAVAHWVKTNVYEANPSKCTVGGIQYTATYSVYDAGDGSGYSIIRHTPCGPDTEYSIAFFSRTGDYCNPCQQLAGTAPNGLTCTGESCGWDVSAKPTSMDNVSSCFDLNDGSATASCVIQGDGDYSAAWKDSTGATKWRIWARGLKFTGQECASTPEAEPTPLPELPPKGKCPGQINGVTVYLPCGDGVSSTPKTSTATTSTPQGTSTTTITEETEVDCKDGECTTKTTKTTTTNGTPTTETSTSTQSKDDFCQKNPRSPHCGGGGGGGPGGDGEGGSFGGSCQTTFVCDGDAIACAIAKATNEARCLLTPTEEVKQVAQQMAAGTWAQNLPSQVRNVGQFNQDNPYGGGCPPDMSFMVAGHTVAIPLSNVCSELQMLGNLLVVLTLFTATVFVVRGLGGT